MGRPKHNPERRAWRGRPHKKGGARVRDLRDAQLEWVGEKCGTRFDEVPPPDTLPDERYKPGDREQCVCGTPGCWAVVKVKSDL